MAGLGDMFWASLATVNGGKPRNSDRIQAGQPLNLRAAFEAAQNIPIAGDALSGGMALYDAAKGDYGSAAMNALGVLPFVTGTFIGKGAKTWDAIKAADADKRIAAGDDVEELLSKEGARIDPMESYKRLAGEAEARATQARMNMNMEQRLNTYPLDSYDVPVDQLIIRGNTPIGAAFTGK